MRVVYAYFDVDKFSVLGERNAAIGAAGKKGLRSGRGKN